MSSASDRLRRLREDLLSLEPYPWAAVETWIAAATPIIRSAFPDHMADFLSACKAPRWHSFPAVASGGGWSDEPQRDNFDEVEAAEAAANAQAARAARDRIAAFVKELTDIQDLVAPVQPSALSTVLSVLDHFPMVARRLATRPQARDPLVICDEYDVQYVLNALLTGVFEDVRVEEGTPGTAGHSSRVDFLLKAERIAIETKYARATHADRSIADELMVDRARYAVHPDCGTLVCFIYDPLSVLRNPVALERDLSVDGPLRVLAVVRPK